MSKAIKRAGKSTDGKAWAFVTFNEKDADRLEEIFSGSDRVAVIVGIAYLDELLTELLKAFLVNDDALENIFDPAQKGILSTFAGKVDMAFLLGLISEDVKTMLKRMAGLRNLFAHRSDISSFELMLMEAKQNKHIRKTLNSFKKHSSKFVTFDKFSTSDPDTRIIPLLYQSLLSLLETELKVARQTAKKQTLVELKSAHTIFSVQL